MAKPPPGQTTFQEFLGDANSSWTGFPKLKLTTPDTKIIHAVIRLCPQSALQVIKLPLYPNSPELRLLTRQCPNLKRLHVDAPGSFSFRNARGNWLVDDICGAFVHLEWLVLGGIFDSDIERLSVSKYQHLSMWLLEMPYTLLKFTTNMLKSELGD